MIFVNEQKIDIISNAGFCGNSTKFLHLRGLGKDRKFKNSPSFKKKVEKNLSKLLFPTSVS